MKYPKIHEFILMFLEMYLSISEYLEVIDVSQSILKFLDASRNSD